MVLIFMAESQSILNIGNLLSLFIGAAVGVSLDRLLRRIESRPLFRIQLGYFDDVELKGKGIMLTIENVGLNPIPEYTVYLYKPDRGSFGIFHGKPDKLVFPQYPQQNNEFKCVTKPDPGTHNNQKYLMQWLCSTKDKDATTPNFTGFKIRIELKSSRQVLFEDEGLGNSVAKYIYTEITGKKTEDSTKDVFYKSQAPFWVEWIRNYRIKK